MTEQKEQPEQSDKDSGWRFDDSHGPFEPTVFEYLVLVYENNVRKFVISPSYLSGETLATDYAKGNAFSVNRNDKTQYLENQKPNTKLRTAVYRRRRFSKFHLRQADGG